MDSAASLQDRIFHTAAWTKSLTVLLVDALISELNHGHWHANNDNFDCKLAARRLINSHFETNFSLYTQQKCFGRLGMRSSHLIGLIVTKASHFSTRYANFSRDHHYPIPPEEVNNIIVISSDDEDHDQDQATVFALPAPTVPTAPTIVVVSDDDGSGDEVISPFNRDTINGRNSENIFGSPTPILQSPYDAWSSMLRPPYYCFALPRPLEVIYPPLRFSTSEDSSHASTDLAMKRRLF